MSTVELVRSLIEYHQAMTRRVWDSIAHISEEQFLAEEAYSRGSLRNLMVHLGHTDRNWLTGLKNLPDIRGQLKKYDEYPDRATVRAYWEEVAVEVAEYVAGLTESKLKQHPDGIPAPRWVILLHIANHGTDHRATILQKLNAFGAPTFDQDYVLWLWSREAGQR